MKHTKIIATIGPASDSVKALRQMVDAGMDVARLNFSHGSHEYFRKVIRNLRRASKDTAILLDTRGPEIRAGRVQGGGVLLEQGRHVVLTNEEVVSDGAMLTIRYSKLGVLNKGDLVALDDGSIETRVVKKDRGCIVVEVVEGGLLGPDKGVALPGHRIELPFLSAGDKKDIRAFEKDVDFIAASFVRDAGDVRQLRTFLNSNAMIISKIEHWEAVQNMDEIIQASDGIMVARGDLGVEVTLEKVPGIQMQAIRRCNELGKPVIVATQMLESMKTNPRPTRAEVGDVANAILQGTDAVMLSGETTVGRHPVRAVGMMNRIAAMYDPKVDNAVMHGGRDNVAEFVAESAYQASQKLGMKAILTPTESGFTARNVSRFKPKVPIYAMSPNRHVLRQLNLSWGVVPVCLEKSHNKLEKVMLHIVSECVRRGLLSLDDNVVITGGYRLRQKGGTNLLEISRVSDILSRA